MNFKHDAQADDERAACRQRPGAFMPVIDRNRCEGKGPCVDACRFNVLQMGVIGPSERAALSWLGRIKAMAHGHRQAFAVRVDVCAACGDCVTVCPERAIRLHRAVDDSNGSKKPQGRIS